MLKLPTYNGARRDREAGVVKEQAVAIALGQTGHLHHIIAKARAHGDLDAIN
jgi:hypothetical protein